MGVFQSKAGRKPRGGRRAREAPRQWFVAFGGKTDIARRSFMSAFCAELDVLVFCGQREAQAA
jgi:hypothetical protein